jgi:shikimate dehydrogenase
VYDKRLLKGDGIEQLILDLREEKIHGLNVTVPFKKTVIPFLDVLSEEARHAESVNTIYKKNNKIVGENTDIEGFKVGLETTNQIIKNKEALILGAGGVVPSIIIALKKMQISKIYLSNRTEQKALEIKKLFPEIEVIEWGKTVNFNIIINATSVGLREGEEINIDYEKVSKNKLFYDVIYNPKETNFLKEAKKFGAEVENGKMMFLYQAQKAFFIWHNVLPEVDNETINLLNL